MNIRGIRMISVAMATYNGADYIKKQIISILEQSVSVDEIIIVDDCSTDNTVDILNDIKTENIQKSIDIQIFVNEINLGYTRNFYNAIKKTNGDIIFLADQDDIWSNKKVETMLEVMKNEKCCALCTNFRMIDAEDRLIENRQCYRIHPFVNKVDRRLTEISFGQLIFGNIVQGCTYCFTKEVKDKYLELNTSILIHDHQIMFVASLMGKVLFLNEPLINYRIHSHNAIGFAMQKDGINIEIKKPSKKPFMVLFLDELDQIIKVPNKWYYNLLYYLRIPYLVSKFRK